MRPERNRLRQALRLARCGPHGTVRFSCLRAPGLGQKDPGQGNQRSRIKASAILGAKARDAGPRGRLFYSGRLPCAELRLFAGQRHLGCSQCRAWLVFSLRYCLAPVLSGFGSRLERQKPRRSRRGGTAGLFHPCAHVPRNVSPRPVAAGIVLSELSGLMYQTHQGAGGGL